jgi:hypothetical protein
MAVKHRQFRLAQVGVKNVEGEGVCKVTKLMRSPTYHHAARVLRIIRKLNHAVDRGREGGDRMLCEGAREGVRGRMAGRVSEFWRQKVHCR